MTSSKQCDTVSIGQFAVQSTFDRKVIAGKLTPRLGQLIQHTFNCSSSINYSKSKTRTVLLTYYVLFEQNLDNVLLRSVMS